MLNIALPKGRLGEKVYRLFEAMGYACPELLSETRKLIFENAEAGVKYFLVKNIYICDLILFVTPCKIGCF